MPSDAHCPPVTAPTLHSLTCPEMRSSRIRRNRISAQSRFSTGKCPQYQSGWLSKSKFFSILHCMYIHSHLRQELIDVFYLVFISLYFYNSKLQADIRKNLNQNTFFQALLLQFCRSTNVESKQVWRTQTILF